MTIVNCREMVGSRDMDCPLSFANDTYLEYSLRLCENSVQSDYNSLKQADSMFKSVRWNIKSTCGYELQFLCVCPS